VIATTTDLQELAARLRGAPWVALDTEADSLHAYPEKLCLLQVAIPGEELLVDPLADIHLEPLWEALDGHELIFHAADYDLRLLFQGHHFKPTVIFDTMWAARLLGETRFGLNDALTKHLGIRLEKGAQKANWGKRPLTERMTSYALNDVRHLRALEVTLREKLEAKGRLEWHRQTCIQLIADCAQPERIDLEAVWRVKGHDKLDDLGLAILREIWYWREKEALRGSRPPFFVLRHEKLTELAAAVSKQGLRGLRLPLHLTARRQRSLMEAIERSLKVEPGDRPVPIRKSTRRMTRRELGRAEALRKRRDKHAMELGIDPTLIAPKATLFALGREEPGEWDRLLPWQRQLLRD
jgi:ribonuclease D